MPARTNTKPKVQPTEKLTRAQGLRLPARAGSGGTAKMQTTFKVGDKAVYPAHGVGEVTAIENREISGQSQTFYILRILDNGMKIMIPTNNVRQVGLREVIGRDKVTKVFQILREKDLSVDTTTWNRRYREYMEKIKTGSVFEVAEVLRDLYLLKSDKDLSFCELKLLDTARGLLIKELAVAQNCDEEEVEQEFKKIFSF
jgi:CarD family transcriptional regulator